MLAPQMTVLFQGDSITNAFRKPEELCNAYQMGAGYAMIVTAQLLASRPHDDLTIVNRGVCGEGVRGLQKRWQDDCLDLRPDLLSILIGVNDAKPCSAFGQELPVEQYAATYQGLLRTTRDALPQVRLVLCEPFLLKVGEITDHAIAIVAAQAEVVRALSREFDATLVPLQQVFAHALSQAPAEYWSYDGIHPNAQGHWLIATAWLEAVVGSPLRV